MPDDDLVAEMQFAGQHLINLSCYTQYEVSAYARPGFECRHNRNYWEFGDYVAIGAGAHGKITNPAQGLYHPLPQPPPTRRVHATSQHRRSHPAVRQILTPADLSFEFMLNALRLRDGFPMTLLTERTGLAFHHLKAGLDQALQRGLLDVEEGHIRPYSNRLAIPE